MPSDKSSFVPHAPRTKCSCQTYYTTDRRCDAGGTHRTASPKHYGVQALGYLPAPAHTHPQHWLSCGDNTLQPYFQSPLYLNEPFIGSTTITAHRRFCCCCCGRNHRGSPRSTKSRRITTALDTPQEPVLVSKASPIACDTPQARQDGERKCAA